MTFRGRAMLFKYFHSYFVVCIQIVFIGVVYSYCFIFCQCQILSSHMYIVLHVKKWHVSLIPFRDSCLQDIDHSLEEAPE